MKKKLIFSLLFIIIVIVVIIVLVNYKRDEGTIENGEEINQQKETWYEDGMNEEIAESWKDNILSPNYASISPFTSLYEKYKNIENNKFAEQYIKVYEEMNLDGINDFERDVLVAYIMTKYNNNVNFNLNNLNNVERIWKVAYDENNNAVNTEENAYMRLILFLVNDNGKECFYRISTFDHKYNGKLSPYGGYKVTKIESQDDINKVIGVDINSDTGIWNTTNYDEYVNNTTYSKVEKDEITNIISKYNNFLSLIDEYYNNCYVQYTNNKEEEYEENKPKEPEIGMTATEVKKSTWGEPDKINKDTYSWGTTEQWIYESKGYIYFKNGKVTSISER